MTIFPRLRRYPRKQLDIGWRDLTAAAFYCAFPRSIREKENELESMFAGSAPVLSTFTVRTGFDLLLGALQLPAGSEVLMSALTIKEMVNVVRHHDLLPVPLDLNPHTLAPDINTIEAAINGNTRAIVIAHLFGTRVPMLPVIDLAKKYGLLVIEDCAQAFTGPDFTGHPESDCAMFSFGSIKTMTALGGALLRLKDPALLPRMRDLQRALPRQSRKQFSAIIFTHVIVKLFSLPLLFGLFYRICGLLGADFEKVINKVRGLDEEDWLKEIQWQCSYPLLALLRRRLRSFDAKRLQERTTVGADFARALPRDVSYPADAAGFHSFWVFPILVEARERFMEQLQARGFDGTSAGSALSVVDAHAGRGSLDPARTRATFRKLIYLPVYPNVPARERRHLAQAIAEIYEASAHLRLSDARKIYSATAASVETPENIGDIRAALQCAAHANLPICMLGTGHNLGGHAFVDGAIVLDMRKFNRVLHLHKENMQVTVESGIIWDNVQKAIAPHGLALRSMQSDNIFTVGGSLASNAHGRDVRFPSIVDSVLGFRIMLADGSIRSVSRLENPDLFRHAIGGYGLFGVVLDVDLALESDCVYQQASTRIPLAALPDFFANRVRANPANELFLARPSISPAYFLDDTIVTTWIRSQKTQESLFRLDHERHVWRDRFLFNLSRRYGWGKSLRWRAEKFLSTRKSAPSLVSRNNAMRPPVSGVKMLDHSSAKDTDAIQEFFIPIPRFLDFMQEMRAALLDDRTNLLGVTVRYVKASNETALPYAPHKAAFAVILYCSELLSQDGRAKADALIATLIRLALNCGGTFYLAYAREMDLSVFREAYPDLDAFFAAKRAFDPENRFTSRFFERYGKKTQKALAASAG